jgi:hypothetical protein
MIQENTYAAAVMQVIHELIAAGTSFDIDQLERIYHDDLQVLMIDDDGNVNEANKMAFKEMFQSKLDTGDPPLNTWAKFSHIEADALKAHVLVMRKVKLMEDEQNLTLSIDLVHEDNRWQVTREVIFARP